jgi:hypothetical protein
VAGIISHSLDSPDSPTIDDNMLRNTSMDLGGDRKTQHMLFLNMLSSMVGESGESSEWEEEERSSTLAREVLD